MSKAPAQRPSAISLVVYGFELLAAKRLYLSAVCSILRNWDDGKMEEVFIQNTNKKKWGIRAALTLTPMLLLLHYEDFLSGDLIYQTSIILGYLLGGALWGLLAAFVHDWLYFRPRTTTGKRIFPAKVRIAISVILAWLLMVFGILLIVGTFNLLKLR